MEKEVEGKEIKEEIKKKEEVKVISDEDYNALHNVSLKLSEAALKIGYLATEQFKLSIEHAKYKEVKTNIISKVNQENGFVQGTDWTAHPDTKELTVIKRPVAPKI